MLRRCSRSSRKRAVTDVAGSNPLGWMAYELMDGYSSGTLNVVEVLDQCLDGLVDGAAEDGIVLSATSRAFVATAAAASQRRWSEGAARPLEGVPFGVKDIISTEQLPTTGGASILGSSVDRIDAPCVARLRAAGAIMVAKLATSEFAAGQPANATFGPVGNPWDRSRWTGGSSTGSGAALAARFVPLAIGTDTGGSVRIPSAWCGTTGLKATHGRVPRTGALPLSWTLDHIGPMTRSARDCGAMLAAMAGPDGHDPAAPAAPIDPAWGTPLPDLKGRRIGAVRGWFTDICDRDVEAAWIDSLDTLSRAGADVVEVDLPSAHLAFTPGWEILFAEAASLHEHHLDALGQLDPGFVERMLQGRFQLAVDYLRAMRIRSLVLDEALAALEPLDALCTIGAPGTAPRLDDLRVEINSEFFPMQAVHSRATMFGNFTGLPALMLPSGLDRRGMPTAIQLVGRPFDEATILSIGASFQELTDHHRSVPPGIEVERVGSTGPIVDLVEAG